MHSRIPRDLKKKISEFWDDRGGILLMCLYCFTIIAMITFKVSPLSDFIKLTSSCLIWYLAKHLDPTGEGFEKPVYIILTIFYLCFPLHWAIYTIAISFLVIAYKVFANIIFYHRGFIEKARTNQSIACYNCYSFFRKSYVVTFEKMYLQWNKPFKTPRKHRERTLALSQSMEENFSPISTIIKFDTVTTDKQRYFFIFYLDIIEFHFAIHHPINRDIKEKYDSQIKEYLINRTKDIIGEKLET